MHSKILIKHYFVNYQICNKANYQNKLDLFSKLRSIYFLED